MPQFFVNDVIENENKAFISDSDEIKHIVNVLRLGQNDEILAAVKDNYSFIGKILNVKKDLIEIDITSKNPISRKLKTSITLVQSIIKGQKQDYLIQKATELGIKEIIPIQTKNSVVKISSEKDKQAKLEKWQKVAYESVKQCERLDVPIINKMLTLEETLKFKDYDIKFVCAERNDDITIKQYLQDIKHNITNTPLKILIIIGPEGGWDESEFKLFDNYSIPKISLGKMILRAETAAVTALSQVIYEYEF